MRLIDADALLEQVQFRLPNGGVIADCVEITRRLIETAPTIDAVPAEKYNELREAFVDFVCSGVHNPGPYCKNKCPECVDKRGWCTYRRCTGFNPDREGRIDENRN